jgi:hypothetical protein
MVDIICPKCKKGLVKKHKTPDKPYWKAHCFWCGNDFKYKKPWAQDLRNKRLGKYKKVKRKK